VGQADLANVASKQPNPCVLMREHAQSIELAYFREFSSQNGF
jgi:hypothetical protein